MRRVGLRLRSISITPLLHLGQGKALFRCQTTLFSPAFRSLKAREVMEDLQRTYRRLESIQGTPLCLFEEAPGVHVASMSTLISRIRSALEELKSSVNIHFSSTNSDEPPRELVSTLDAFTSDLSLASVAIQEVRVNLSLCSIDYLTEGPKRVPFSREFNIDYSLR